MRRSDNPALDSTQSSASSIDVEVTLDDDVITAVEVIPNASDPTSLYYQTASLEASTRP